MTAEPTAVEPTGTLTGQPMAPRATSVSVPSLSYFRVHRAMLQRELADAAGVDLRSVQRLEAGGRAGLDTVRRLADALHVEPSVLLALPPADLIGEPER